ncbi:replication [Tokyovirus A1]|uniref:replication n=1 Tax=Tokyovirus A1 TaxID=1826170 RepID=UPI0007A96C93|nr:replication [Tokyovirus A1]BAU80052.1 putative replication origin-binding protein [Tokyovirus A1]
MSSTKVRKLPKTIVSDFSSYTFFYPKTFELDSFACPLCVFSGSSKGDLKKHYQSEEHLSEFFKAVEKPPVTSNFWDLQDGESEEELALRTSLMYALGVLPPYLRVETRWVNTVMFSHRVAPESEESFAKRTSRGETYLSKPIEFAINYGRQMGHKLFFVYGENKYSRKYLSFRDFETFWSVYETLPDEEKRFDELFTSESPTKEIFDLETTRYAKGKLNENTIFELFVNARKEFSPEKKLEFWALKSSGREGDKYKYSLHILSSEMYLNLESMGGFIQDFAKFLQTRTEYAILYEMMDKLIYNRNRGIRSPLSRKCGSERKLVPLFDGEDIREFFATAHPSRYFGPFGEEKQEQEEKEREVLDECDDFEEALMDYVEKKLDNCFDVFREGEMWRLQRVSGCWNHCPICDREHEKDNMFAFVKGSGLYLGCYRGEKGERSILLCRKEGAEKNKCAERTSQKPDLPPLCCDEVYREPQVREFVERKRCATFLASAMGTGKTKALARYLSSHPNKSVLVVTYRKSLARELALKFPGFSHYKESPDWTNAEKLIVQIDSLWRVDTSRYDIVVCDEATYTFSRLAKGVKNVSGCWKTMKHHLQKAKEVIFMDKNMSQSLVDVMKLLGLKCHVVKNEFKAHTQRTCFVCPDFEEFKNSLIHDLERGMKLCFASSSKKKLQIICKEAELLDYKVLWYTGDGNSEEVWLESWKNYDLVAYSPTISAGVSYEEKHFDKVYGYFSSRSCPAEECEQMLFRTRDIRANEMVVCFDNRSSPAPVTRKTAASLLEKRLKVMDSIPCIGWDRNTKGRPLNMKHPFTALYVDTVVQENISKRDISGTLINLLKEQGVTIYFAESKLSSIEKKEARQIAREIAEEVKEEEFQGISSAREVERPEFSYLCALEDRTREENFSCKKFMQAHLFGVEQKDITVKFLEQYHGQHKQFKNQRMALFGTREEQSRRLKVLASKKKAEREAMDGIERLQEKQSFEKVVYARRLLLKLGFSDVREKKKIHCDEMAKRVVLAKEMIRKSKNFRVLFGEMPKRKEMFWLNGILRRTFGCSIQRNSKKKAFSWVLLLVSPWSYNGVVPNTKVKLDKDVKIPEVSGFEV